MTLSFANRLDSATVKFTSADLVGPDNSLNSVGCLAAPVAIFTIRPHRLSAIPSIAPLINSIGPTKVVVTDPYQSSSLISRKSSVAFGGEHVMTRISG